MVDDNTPTVTARRRKPTRHMRLRLETVKRLRALGAQKKVERVTSRDSKATEDQAAKATTSEAASDKSTIKTRVPKVKMATLAKPPIPKAKFRKRQIHKSWLPTHLFHAKRAHMTPPSAPLWRFAIPLTPTQKSYRPTHRARTERGAVAWDTSYMATVGLEGQQRSIEGMLKALGVGVRGCDEKVWGAWGQKWRSGTRVLETFVSERESPHQLIAPVTIVWRVPPFTDEKKPVDDERRSRKVVLRVNPSAFFQLWEEVVRLAKVAKPSVGVEDLRFEIGSIEITGPGSTEALLGAVWSSPSDDGPMEGAKSSVKSTWMGLAGLTNPSTLPTGALLAFNIKDPRLHHPPRTIPLPKTQDPPNQLLELLADWPVDKLQSPPELFERSYRFKGSKLPSQKVVNRRKSLAKPGEYPEPLPADPHIPVLLYTNSNPSNNKQQGTWTLLAPWKCIQPIWYSVMYYPLSTGQQPRFGGLREMQQLAFEAGRPWFPADFPGTKAGWDWEVQERRKRWEERLRRPKGKRVSWEKVDLGDGRKGEVGEGWACDWRILLDGFLADVQGEGGVTTAVKQSVDQSTENAKSKDAAESPQPEPPPKPDKLAQKTSAQALDLLRPSTPVSPGSAGLYGNLITVRLTLLTRGVPQTCARIYGLPSASTNPELRNAWLALLPSKHKHRGPKNSLPKLPKDAPPHIVQQRLAQSLLEPPRAGEDVYPACPGVEDLVGFVTTGNFNLAEGKGTGIGNLLVGKVLWGARAGGEGGRLCVVRNSGVDVARLARWDIV